MVFNKEQNRYVYSRLLPFSSGNAEGEYQTKIRIPKGESEFYAFYAPNQTGKDLPYYTPGGILQNAVPWNFLGEGMEEVDRRILSKPHSLPSSGSRMTAVSAFRWTTRTMV